MRAAGTATIGALIVGLVWIAAPQIWMRPPAPAYVWLARQLRAGGISPSIYDDQAVSDELARSTNGRVHDIISPTPPSAAVLVAPLAFVADRSLTAVWATGNAIALSVAFVLLASLLPRAGWAVAGAGLLFWCFLRSDPFAENAFRGQLYAWMLLGFSLVAVGVDRKRDELTAIGLASVLLMKAAGLPAMVALVAGRRWRVLAWTLAIAVGVVLLALPWTGVAVYGRWLLDVVPRWMQTPMQAVPAYQTIGGFFSHLFRYDSQWNRAPILDAPWLGSVAAAAVTVTLIAAIALQRFSLVAIAAAIAVGIIIQPVGEQYHYLSAAVPLVVGAAACVRDRRPYAAVAITTAAYLMFATFDYRNPSEWTGLSALLVYPRLFGGLILVATLLRLNTQEAISVQCPQKGALTA